MLELANRTRWVASVVPGWGCDRAHQLTVVVKRVYRFALDGSIEPVGAMPSLVTADRHRGDPADSSLEVANEAMPFKSGGELLVTGTAHPPRADARAMETWVELSGDRQTSWQKRLRIAGPRHWTRTFFGAFPSQPEPLQPLPLIYEHAFGGVDRACKSFERRNPAGKGYARRGRIAKGQALPQIEQGPRFIAKPMDHPQPAGYGPIPAAWLPRARDNREPLENTVNCPYSHPVPPALFNTAPVDQRFPDPFRGGERITLGGLFPAEARVREVSLRLPGPEVQAMVWEDGERRRVSLTCDTVHVDTDERLVTLIERVGIPRRRSEQKIGWVVLDPIVRAQEVAS